MQSSVATALPPARKRAAIAGRLHPVWLWGLVPAAASILYPYALKYSYLSGAASSSSVWLRVVSWLSLLCALLVPAIGLYFARALPGDTHMRRVAYISVIVPAIYVFLGDIQRIFHSPVSDELVWWTLWIILAATAVSSSQDQIRGTASHSTQRWRAVHAVNAALLTIFVLFHLLNQGASLWGQDAYTHIQTLGQRIYRMPVIEAILVGLMISQVISGLRIAWRWGPLKTDTARVMQVGAGMFLAVFIVAHMLSIFLYTRTVHATPTDWNYAIGAPLGLRNDLWNIRLIPYYGYGIFFVLSHIISGIRWMLIQQGAALQTAHRGWLVGHVVAGALSIAVLAGLILPTL